MTTPKQSAGLKSTRKATHKYKPGKLLADGCIEILHCWPKRQYWCRVRILDLDILQAIDELELDDTHCSRAIQRALTEGLDCFDHEYASSFQ